MEGQFPTLGKTNTQCAGQTREFKTFHKIARVAERRGQFVKTLKIQVKFILNSTRTQCDYLFVTQGANFSENSPCTLKRNQPAPKIKESARKQFTTQEV